MGAIRLALSQFGAELGDVGANLGHMRDAVVAGAAADAEVVCFPELSLSGYLLEAADYTDALLEAVRRAERELAAQALRHSITIVYGAPLRDEGLLRNAVILEPGHGRRLVYAKTHMVAKELRVFAAGGEFMSDERGLGLACCYDLAFPEAMRVVTLRGARVLLVPMAWEVERSFVIAHLMAARAIENVAYVVGVNQCGNVGDLRFSGASSVVDPLGETILQLGGGPELAIVDVDLDLVARLRDGRDPRAYPLFADRRPELYAPVSMDEISPTTRGVLSQTSVCCAPSLPREGVREPGANDRDGESPTTHRPRAYGLSRVISPP